MSDFRALPIYELRERVACLAARGERVRGVIEAPTGSGKSTGLPQILVDSAGLSGKVVVLQPRRVAARMLARRVAWERGADVGGEVGYQVRFERATGKDTRIEYVTEGVLLRRLQGDPRLAGVAAVVFDEFHERHVDGDVGLALLRQLQESERPDLQLYVVSATLDGLDMARVFPDAELLRAEGRMFPVEVRHAPREARADEPVWSRAVAALEEAVRGGAEGDALIFMPGAFEIRKTLEILGGRRLFGGWRRLPLHGELPPERQDEALAPAERGARKVVVATNLAETSLTIDGVKIVVDSGVARMAAYDPMRGMNTLTVRPISRASADQRAGRAGRTAPGLCLRLWTARDQSGRAAQTPPEIHRIDPSGVILDLLAMGVVNPETFPWIEAPEAEAFRRAMGVLRELAAVDADGHITPIGREMVTMPVHPRLSRFLVEARRRGCHEVAFVVAGLVEGRPIFSGATVAARAAAAERHTERGDRSDFQAAVRAFSRALAEGFDVARCESIGVRAGAVREVARLARQLSRLGGRSGGGEMKPRSEGGEDALWTDLAGCLMAAFSDHVAVQVSQGARLCEVVGGRRGKIARESRVAAGARLVVAVELAEIEGRKLESVLRDVTRIEEDWLAAMFADDFCERSVVVYDHARKRVVSKTSRFFRDLVLESKVREDVPADRAAEVLAAEVVGGRVPFPGWDGKVEAWLARLRRLAEWMPELELPEFTDEDKAFVIAQACLGASGARDLKKREVWPVLGQWLSPEQRAALDAYAPEKVRLENGVEAKVVYTTDGSPEIAVVLQRLYDVERQPTVAGGRVPVVVNILGPNHRPVQKTGDLAAFWKNSYAGVRDQLKGRYPKHEWR